VYGELLILGKSVIRHTHLFRRHHGTTRIAALSVIGQTKQSKSHSISASVVTTDECSLSYEYVNEPAAGAPTSMHTHRGTAVLKIDKTVKALKGEYYSGRDRQNFGIIELIRSKKQ